MDSFDTHFLDVGSPIDKLHCTIDMVNDLSRICTETNDNLPINRVSNLLGLIGLRLQQVNRELEQEIREAKGTLIK